MVTRTHALNLGDQVARAYPRVYIDADVVVTLSTIRKLVQRLQTGEIIAVAPRPNFELTNCSWAVRSFYNIRCRLPSFREGIGGSGVYVLSEIARRRFGVFPTLVADDAFVRIQFKPQERETLASVCSTVFAPRKISNLITIETRADFGNFELVRLYPALWANKGDSNRRALISLFARPLLWPPLLVYLYVRILARQKAKRLLRNRSFLWERDDTSRAGTGSAPAL